MSQANLPNTSDSVQADGAIPEYEPNPEAEAARAMLLFAMFNLEDDLEVIQGKAQALGERRKEALAAFQKELQGLVQQYSAVLARYQAIKDFLST